ncbi:MAG: hypothetical protein K2K70_03045 [Lachnospiraceae bacterium]|nr:hypothetical protein [Lachnospiraceae bacterium]
MNYFQWRRKIKACATLLLLSSYILWLLLLNEITAFQIANYIPVEIQYPLSEIPDNQAVLTIRISTNTIVCDYTHYVFIVNKKGQWKVANVVDDPYFEQYEIYDDFFEERVLQDENIPWQKTKIKWNQELLEQAINMPDLEYQCKPAYTYDIAHVWNPSYIGHYMYYQGTPVKQNYTVLYLQKKCNQLEKMGMKAIMENKGDKE